MEEEKDKSYVVDPRLEAYTGFLEDDFCEQAFKAADYAKKITHLILHLMADWRSISYAVAFPAIGPSSVESFHVGMLSAGPHDYSLLGFLQFLLHRLRDRIPTLASDQILQEELGSEIRSLIEEMSSLQHERDNIISARSVWKEFINQHPMYMGIHGIMRLSYIGIFGAYEEFLVRSSRLASGQVDLRSSDRSFSTVLKQSLGQDICNLCWTSSEINNVRTIRNRLIHAGGKAQGSDSALTPLIHIQDGYIHVFPSHIVKAYSIMKAPILTLLAHEAFA
jgi:hypothetical protein